MADRRVVETLFQQYSPDLAELLNHCVPRTTIQLYSKNLVTKEVKEWTQSAQGVSDFEKAVKVLSSAETILKHSPDLFNVFLSSLIAAESSFDEIVEKISKDYEKLLKVADEPDSTSGCSDESLNSKILDDTTGPSTDENLDSKDSPDAKSSSKPDVGEKIEQLQSDFLTLEDNFVSELTNNVEVTPRKVLRALTILPLALQKQSKFIKEKLLPSGNTGSVEVMLAHVTSYTTFLDFALIKHLIETFGSEKHKQDISAHASSVEAFKRETTVQELIDHWPGEQELPSDAERLVAVIDADPRTYSLLKLDQLRKRICISINLSDTLSIIVGVAVSNSFVLRLMIPSVLLDTITPAEMLGDIADVTSLMIEGQNRYLYLSPAMSVKKAECEEKLWELCVNNTGDISEFSSLLGQPGVNPNFHDEKGRNVLMFVSYYGRIDRAQLLIEYQCDVNIPDEDGFTPLIVASQAGHEGVVGLLLDKGANVDQQNKDGGTPLYAASQKGHEDVVALLLDKGANVDQQTKDGHTPLYLASYNGHKGVVDLLLDKGAKVDQQTKDGRTPLYVASEKGHKGVVDLLLNKGANVIQQDKNGATPLYVASQKGHKGVVDLLLNKGANVDQQNKNGSTALRVASVFGHTDVVRLLVTRGATVNIVDKDGNTPLYVASANGHKGVVDLLLDKGANVDQQNKEGVTPLIIASQERHTEVVQTLISKGAAVDLQREDGMTALCWASYKGEKEIVEILVNAGANLNIQDEYEMTALMLAIQLGHKNIAFTLIKEKADLNITDKTTGWSAIFFAAKQGFTDVARQLLDKGADATLKDKNGVTAFNIAKLNNNEEICDLLMNYYNVDKTEEKVTENQKKQVKLSYQRLLSSLAKRLLPGREEKRRWEQSRKNQNQTEATTFNKEEEDIVVAQ